MTTAYLLNSSVLIVLVMDSHIHRWRVIEWIERSPKKIALSSIMQGAVLRVYMRSQESATFEQGFEVLWRIAKMPEVVFQEDNGDYLDVPARGIRGHRQVREAYFAHVAEENQLNLATLDLAQSALYPKTCRYIS
jgi:hypothetical protein